MCARYVNNVPTTYTHCKCFLGSGEYKEPNRAICDSSRTVEAWRFSATISPQKPWLQPLWRDMRSRSSGHGAAIGFCVFWVKLNQQPEIKIRLSTAAA